MGLIERMKSNIKTGIKPPALKDNFWAAVGGVSYVALPTMASKVLNVDMDGWKGFATGVLGTAGIGLTTGQAGLTAGALGAAAAHLCYAKGNTFVDVFGKYPYSLDIANRTLQVGGMNDAIPSVSAPTTRTLPDGTTITGYNSLASSALPTVREAEAIVGEQSAENAGLMDYIIDDGSAIHDYISGDGETLNDYISAEGAPLSDYFSIENPSNNTFSVDGY